MKQWYDGYLLEGAGSVYNPNSVVKAARTGRCRSYWTESSAAESLLGYIARDERGLSNRRTCHREELINTCSNIL